MKKALIIYLGWACLLFAGNLHAQSNAPNLENLQEKMRLYSKINAKALLFVHTDKTVYTNNESIWFAGYIINAGPSKTDDHTLLSVSLMHEADRRIIYTQQNVMGKGLSNGSLLIPDNTPPGNYIFNAYTNVLDQHGHPVAIFSQPVTIKSITKRAFSATLRLLDTVVNNGSIRANIILDIKDEKRFNNPTITYGLVGGNNQKLILSAKESMASISIPASQLTSAEPVLLARVAYYYDTVYLSVKLPKQQDKGINLRFLPEGGNLCNGLESVVAIETTTTNGLQVPLTGIIYNGNTPIDTISTNSYGIASFKLKPDINSRYTFKIKANAYLNKDSIYQFPVITQNDVVMHLKEAVVNDTLKMVLYSKAQQKIQVLIHNYRETFSLFNSYAYPHGKNLSLVVSSLPKGLATVTILDEGGRPLAERLFFAHYNQQTIATITTHKPLYGKRDSVLVKINLRDQAGTPVKGLVSVAAVQQNRLEGAKQRYIDNYTFISSELSSLPRDPLRRGIDNKDYLEYVLLTRGWRRYTWQGMTAGKASDTIKIGLPPQFKGNVLSYGYKVKKAHNLLTLPTAASVTTNADGSFVLKQEQITVPERQKAFLWLNRRDIQGYEIKTTNPFNAIDLQVAENITIANTGITKAADSSTDQELGAFAQNNLLKEANIKATKNDHVLFGAAAAVNDCGDYVCSTGYLNCPFDPPARLPVKGIRYKRLNGNGTKLPPVVYEGCTSNGVPTSAVYTAREFYGLNRNAEESFEPQYLSTLFWKPGIVTNEKGEASFSFFTGDIEGRFSIVSQGVADDDVIYGEEEFSVK